MPADRRAQYCPNCQCFTMFDWHEPRHHAYSLMALTLIGCQLVTPVTGALLLAAWAHRIAQSRKWTCPKCHRSARMTAAA